MNKNEIKNAIENIATTNGAKVVVIPSKLTETANATLDTIKRVDESARLITDYKEGSATSYTILNAPTDGDIQKALRYEIYIKRTRLIAYIGNLSPLALVGVNNSHLNGTSHQYAKTKEVRLVYDNPLEFIEDISKAYPTEEKDSKPKAKTTSKRKTTTKKSAKAV